MRPERPIPYLPSVKWMGAWLSGATPRTERKRLPRTVIHAAGRAPETLTVPVAGGRSALKSQPADTILVSDHGRWADVHIGAFEAAYGRTPFYRHIEPLVAPLLLDSPGRRLTDLNLDLLDRMARFLNLRELLPAMKEFGTRNPGRLREIAASITVPAIPDLSALDPVCKFGPDTIFLIASAMDI